MTESEVREIVRKELPDREIGSIEKKLGGYLVSAYDKDVGPMDMSGTLFKVSNNGKIHKLSLDECFKIL